VFNNHAGINLTESKLQLVEICYKEDSFYLENVNQAVHFETLAPDLAENKIISILQESYDKLTKKKLLHSKSVSFALPNNFFKIFEVPYDDALIKKDLHEHFRWELSVLFPGCDKDNFYIQYVEINKSSIRPEKKAIVFAISKTIITAINKFCIHNSLELKFIDNVHLASNAFLYLDKPQTNNEFSLSIYIDSKYSSLSAVDGVHPFYFKVLNPESSNTFDELNSTLEKLHEFNITIADFGRVFLYGQDITGDFENKLKALFDNRLKKINPFSRLKADESLLKNPFYKMMYNSFTAAAGIAIRIV
jgi:Tfp pilus assembly PilM family ATPase